MPQIQLRDPQGQPLTLMNIRISEGEKSSDEAIFDVFTDYAGNTGWPIPFWPSQDYTLHVNYANVHPKFQAVSVLVPKDQTDNVAITVGRVEIPAPPVHHGDLLAWPRRGASIAASLLDARWDYEAWAKLLGSYFGNRGLTRTNILSASWPESSPHFVWPFTKLPDGRFDLYAWNPAFFERLARYTEAMNRHGVVPIYTFLELYSWSYRKNTAMNKALDWPTNNVNGIRWMSTTRAEDDRTLSSLPDAWLQEFVAKCVGVIKNAGVAVIEPGNEFPEKPIHFAIAGIVKAHSDLRVQVNRNEDTPGQYFNMATGVLYVDQIAFHGWKDLGFLDKVWPDEPAKRPRTFRQFFENRAQDGRFLNVDYSRVCCSSDGSRASNDPIDTYDWEDLLKVFKFVADKGGSIEHQSRAKMHSGANLLTVETSFLQSIADL